MGIQGHVSRGNPDASHHRQVGMGVEVARRGLRNNVTMMGNCHRLAPRYNLPHLDHVEVVFHVFFRGEGHIWVMLLLLLLLYTVFPFSLSFPLSSMVSL